MKIVCDNCSTKYSIADEKVRGKVFKIKCKKCSHIIVVKGEAVTGEGQPAGFDQKETRVFDYSGFEGQRSAGGAAPAAPADVDPIWHLVIDREQVGPLTVAELGAKWAAGEIDKETYAWREGFADWQRLAAIEELASLTARGGAGAPAAAAPAERRSPVTDETDAGGLFGGATSTPAAGSAPTAGRSDPADLFAGAGSSTEDEAPSDLFGGASDRAAAAAPAAGGVFSSSAAAPSASARRSVREELFGGNEGGADVGGAAEPLGAAPRPEVRSMTAQRNENSVLFSLNNLSALAASEPQAAAPTTRSSGLGSSFGASGAEGSGLIDIRAMAAMTLGATKKEEQTGPRARASEDDLPVFSATSFSAPAAGVLLPTVQPQANNKLMYIFMGVVGLLATAAIVLVAVIFLGKKDPDPGEALGAAVTPSEPASPAAAAATANPPSTPPSMGPSTTPSGTPAPATTPPSASPPPATPAPAATPAAAPRAPEKRPERTPPRAETTRPTPAPAPAPAATPAAPPPAAPAPSKAAQKCDEVACLVSPDLPCCPKKGSGGTRPAATPSGGDSGVPDQLEQADIINGMKSVNGKVMACNDRFRVPGSFKVRITVGPDGNVSGATAEPPIGGTPAAGCVESAVRGAKFKKTKRAITFKYPYTFR